jgi:hypothetical protein
MKSNVFTTNLNFFCANYECHTSLCYLVIKQEYLKIHCVATRFECLKLFKMTHFLSRRMVSKYLQIMHFAHVHIKKKYPFRNYISRLGCTVSCTETGTATRWFLRVSYIESLAAVPVSVQDTVRFKLINDHGGPSPIDTPPSTS